ncbi:MAG: cytochrome C-binding protein, partial [Betaproteobacteria bacterium]|nr:cytochrome C-binding protein [Betaproteobacteria bacterium]
MKRIAWGLAFPLVLAATAVFSQPGAPAITSDPQKTPPWAYTLLPPGLKVPDDGAERVQLPGSKVTYTRGEIRDLFSAKDWFPEEHPAMPAVVASGRKPDVYACGMCHYPNGQGKPENAS